MSLNNFYIQSHRDLELWPSDPKMTNQHVKYEDFVMNSFQDNQQKPF